MLVSSVFVTAFSPGAQSGDCGGGSHSRFTKPTARPRRVLKVVTLTMMAALGVSSWLPLAGADTLVTTPRGDEWRTKEQPWIVDPGSAEVTRHALVCPPLLLELEGRVGSC
jgi:hypothetical protein